MGGARGDVVDDSEQLAADANGDRAVDFKDLVILAQNYGQSNTTWQQADFTGDAKTDFQDLVLLAQRYNNAPVSSADVTVTKNTEPAQRVFNTATPIRPAPQKRPAPKMRKP